MYACETGGAEGEGLNPLSPGAPEGGAVTAPPPPPNVAAVPQSQRREAHFVRSVPQKNK